MAHDDILKWIATSLLIIGTIFLNLGDINIGRILLFVGGVFWLYVSILWKEPALIIANTVILLSTVLASVYKYLTTGVI
jgi:hypothetical protein